MVAPAAVLLHGSLSSQDGTVWEEQIISVTHIADDEFVLSGYTAGSFAASSSGEYDFAAVKLGANGTILWSWQVTSRVIPPISRVDLTLHLDVKETSLQGQMHYCEVLQVLAFIPE